MSTDSSNEPGSPAEGIGQDAAAWDALVAELGLPGVPDPSTNSTLARDVVRVLRQVRGFIAEAMHRERVGVRELARRVGIAPSAASRIMRSDNDMYISTAVRLAEGLGKKIDIRLIDDALSASNRIVCEVAETTIPPPGLPLPDASGAPPRQTRSPLAGMVLTVPSNVRLPNLVGAEAVEVWMEVNGQRVPLGRLVVKDVFAAASTAAE